MISVQKYYFSKVMLRWSNISGSMTEIITSKVRNLFVKRSDTVVEMLRLLDRNHNVRGSNPIFKKSCYGGRTVKAFGRKS